MNFKIGFWNYVSTGVMDTVKEVKNWSDLGMNFAMTTEYTPSNLKTKREIKKELKACEKYGIQVFVADSRTRWHVLKEKGEEEFRKGIWEVRKDFAKEKAVYAFHVGDEPQKQDYPFVIQAAKIIKEIIPEKEPFVNLYPYGNEEIHQNAINAFSPEEYTQRVVELTQQGNFPQISYDCYAQCLYREDDREEGIDGYFRNLKIFADASAITGKPYWTSLLSVGHWVFRSPTEDDFRWQISTAAAHGCKGILWFLIYLQSMDSSYRDAPIDEYGNRTATFEALARQNKIFLKYYGDKFAKAKLIRAEHFGKVYGGMKPFETDDTVLGVSVDKDAPLIISRFEKENGEKAVVVVNNSQREIVNVKITLAKEKEEDEENIRSFWLSPGQLQWLEMKRNEK